MPLNGLGFLGFLGFIRVLGFRPLACAAEDSSGPEVRLLSRAAFAFFKALSAYISACRSIIMIVIVYNSKDTKKCIQLLLIPRSFSRKVQRIMPNSTK